MVPFSFFRHEWIALPEGALFWPSRRALVVADLHLEKASWFARFGQLLPPYDSLATLSDLRLLAVGLDAQEVWCLGDSFHDRHGCERLPHQARELLLTLTGALRWTWITGNHDSELSDPCGGHLLETAEIDGIVLRHHADPTDRRPELSGHYHPKLRISHRGRSLSRRCFITGRSKIILPAFGSLTGGLDAGHPEIARAVGEEAQAMIPLADRLLRFPIALPRPVKQQGAH